MTPAPTTITGPRRQWPIRLILVAVVFALVLPGLVFAGVLVGRIATIERNRTEEGLAAAARRAADTLDRELASLSAALRALATSPALAEGDMQTFERQARAVATEDQAFVLSDPSGNQLINTRRPRGSALPRMANMDTIHAVVRTGQTTASDLFVGAVSGTNTVVLMHPVSLGNQVRYILAINLQPLYLSRLIQAQNLPPGWIASVVDGNGRVIARSRDPDRMVGRTGPSLQPRPDGTLLTGTSLDGDPILVAVEPLRLARWQVGVGIGTATAEAPLRATRKWLAVTGLATLAVASLLAFQLARSVARPLHRLARAGNDMAAGRPVTAVLSRVAEVDSVFKALERATHDLRDRAEALDAERAQLQAVFETVPVGLVIAVPGGRVVAANRRLDRMLRRPPGAADAVPAFGHWPARHADGSAVAETETPMARVLAGSPNAELNCLCRRGDGSEFWVRVVAAPIPGRDGTVSGGVAAILDIDEVTRARQAQARFAEDLERQVADRTAAAEAATERLRTEAAARARAEEQLHQVQKMEAVGQLTGGIAHDFNNLLTVVIGSLDLLRRRAADDRSRRLVDNALDGATRAATLTARLLAFSRRQPLIPQPLDVNRLVTGMSDLLHRTLGEAVQLETVLAGGVWQTHADPNQLENAILNLAVNARDAMADRSDDTEAAGPVLARLVIATGNAALLPDFAPHDTEFQPGDYVRIAVTDTGTGMPPEVLARVFEPFFTTKPLGKGTGLGLSQVHGFVKQSGGLVTLDSTPGQGTTVALHLPRLHTEPAAGDPTPLPEHAPNPTDGTRLTVLVVEDDAGVRRFSAEALRELGHTVLETGHPPEALRLLDAHPEIDLLLTDVVLPVMDGPRLATEARRRRPALPVLFASGYTGSEAMNKGLLPDGAPLLQKPFTLGALSAKLAEVAPPAPP